MGARFSKAMKVIVFANTDWYLYNFRRTFALAAVAAGYEVLLVSPPGDYDERLKRLGLNWRPLPMKRQSLNPFREIAVILRLVRIFREERPQIVHAFTVKCVIYASIASRMSGVFSRISAVAGLGYVFSSQDIKARLLRPIVKLLMRDAFSGNSSRVILQNSDDAALLERMNLVDRSRIRLIRGSGVDCSRFLPPSHGNANGGEVRVLLAARLLWNKGVSEYVEAASVLRSKYPNSRFLLAGNPDPGNPASVPEEDVLRWNAQGVVEWLGHVDDMAELFASVDMFVLPSYYGEGLPKSLIEAASCELPLVTCDIPGCREVVTDMVDGLLVPPRDVGALVQAISYLLDNKDQRERLGKAARAKALSKFDEKMVISNTLDVYDDIRSCYTTQP
jgi:glycosyltransferase involved in cell wall biosynthesis